MAATWDLWIKELVKERPQDFVTLALKGACYVERRESQYQMREIRMDRLVVAELKGRQVLINFEIQIKKDKKMGKRLLEYSLAAMEEYQLPILSCVIYLRKAGKLSEPPLCWILPDGRRILWFDFVSIELASKTTEELREMNLLGVLPLFILSKDGRKREVLDEVVTRLQDSNESELLSVTRLCAEAVFTSKRDKAWLARRFAMLKDISETPTYRRLVAEGREEGVLLGMRQSIVILVQSRFPSLRLLVEKQLEAVTDLEILRQAVNYIGGARTAREIRQYLLNLPVPSPEP